MSKAPSINPPRPISRQSLVIVTARKGQFVHRAQEFWAFRELLWVLTARDIKVRYKQAVLGVAWALLQPFLLMVVFSIFFGKFARMPSDGTPYPLFAYCGLLPWTLFSNALSNSSNSVLASSHLISKVYFPRLIIPLASIGSCIADFAIAAGLLLGMMLFFHTSITVRLIAVPVLLIGVLFLSIGLGCLLSALTVAYRDFRYLIPLLIQLWMFATPVVYPSSLVPAEWRWILQFNPMAGFVDGFRGAFLGLAFDIPSLAIAFGISIAALLVGVSYFERAEGNFVDDI